MSNAIDNLKIQSDILDDITLLNEYKKLRNEIGDVIQSEDENNIEPVISEDEKYENNNITEKETEDYDSDEKIIIENKDESGDNELPENIEDSQENSAGSLKKDESDIEIEKEEIKEEIEVSQDIPENLIKSVIESLLFISGSSVTFEKMQKVINIDYSKFRKHIFELNNLYKQNNHCFRIVEVANGFQIVTRTELADYIRKFFGARKVKHFPPSTLEVLAVIAYRQPVTKGQVEHIRGVNSDAQIQVLIEKKMIQIIGRAEELGRPLLYGTTKEFLEYFGLKDLSELPDSKELDQILAVQRQEETQKIDKILGEIDGTQLPDGDKKIEEIELSDTEKSLQERIVYENKQLEEEKALEMEFIEVLEKSKQTKKNTKEMFEKFNSDLNKEDTEEISET